VIQLRVRARLRQEGARTHRDNRTRPGRLLRTRSTASTATSEVLLLRRNAEVEVVVVEGLWAGEEEVEEAPWK